MPTAGCMRRLKPGLKIHLKMLMATASLERHSKLCGDRLHMRRMFSSSISFKDKLIVSFSS
ncbi:hypothetical protein DPMN_120514 [Dreissena polymorpha]|uniref:Uncharacterized protein n=1 Tax=Dreissena polymorpha TaxID=45954 RepID=A0A9D4GNF6_DREPO|nr:hypothetical protein DPMN_120514 [Dreissena polymorpha]